MKRSLLFSHFLLIILTTQSIISFITTAATTEDFIYDIAGKKVDKNAPYYIGPVDWAKGGGVKLTKTKCPVHVIQDPKEVTKGDPFEFTLNAAKEQFLRTSYPLGISIKSAGKCKETSFLKINDVLSKPPANFLASGGLFNTAFSCFQVVKFPKPSSSNAKVQSYLLQHCPKVCGAGPIGCFNISTYVDNGTKYLATIGTPFEFVFKRA
uniref:kunitz trypsin inhibitor 5-like n=1 Tax=Erigeron canadensis TaxID=72917 RepID=UPI001CB8AD07|nr:kunitz trypsin inhibitor 5-like [Erigeron canadensis]